MTMNDFIKQNIMGAGANNTMTENGAISYFTAGTALLDQFAHAGTARGRDIETVWVEQSQIWGENPEMALRFPFYLRMITRQTNLLDGNKTEKVQKGQGARDEAFKRLLWIAKYHPDEFYRNLWLLPIVGSWKDLWVLLSMDDSLDKNKFFFVLSQGINSNSTRNLVKKYLPRIRSNKVCTTEWAKKTNQLAKDFAKFVGWSFEDYRYFKSTGKAHEFQRLICARDYDSLNWNTIPGKALLNLVSGKFLTNHNLYDRYVEWIKSQPVAKFNGYPFELALKLGEARTISTYWSYGRYVQPKRDIATEITVNKQFDNLIATANKDGKAIDGNVLVALDTSGSMTCPIEGGPKGLTSYDVAVSLGIYFSELNTGEFHDTVVMFDNVSTMLKLKTKTFSDKWYEIRSQRDAMGGTNFQSVIDLIVETRKNHPEIPLEDYPTTILVVSDLQFNPSGSRWNGNSLVSEQTNYEALMTKLRTVFPSDWVEDFKCVWWYCARRKEAEGDVPATMEHGGQYLFSGFDGAVISLICNGETKFDENGNKVKPTMEELVQSALSQEVLELIK